MQARSFSATWILKIAAFVVAAMALLALMALPAWALADDSSSAAASGTSASSSSAAASGAAASASASSASPQESATSVEGIALPMTGNDFVWFGRELNLGQYSIENDLLAAGQTVVVSDCTAGGSIRAAAQDIAIANSTASENITVAGQDVIIRDSKANAVAVAGKAVTFSGSCNELTAYAESVFIDGVVEGDVVVGANTVEVGTNARIKGTLHVRASSDPVMQRGAEVGDVDFKETEGSASTAEVEEAMAALSSMLAIMMAIIGIIGTLIVAVLAEWLFRCHTEAAANMIRTRTGATIGTGIVAALVAPIAIVILLCLVITLPVALGLTFALLAMTCVAGGFAGASLFKLAFPRLGRYKCALAGGAIMGVAGAIPILGGIVDAAAFMYLLGYVLQAIFLGLRKTTPAAPVSPAAPAPPEAVPAPAAPVPPAAAPTPGAPAATPTASGETSIP